jgi:DNA-binding NtrC family response regulator
MKAGAFDFVPKPVDEIRLYAVLQHARERRFLDEQVSALSERLLAGGVQHPEAFSGIVTQSEAMYGVFRYLEAVSLSPKPVFITGESGTGKELFAKAVHGLRSPDGPFVPVNVAGLEDAVFSDTLFGHHRGAFTGADGVRKGLVEQAAGGTLFLDEIGDLELASQVKLLRFLQEEEYYPLGSDKPVAARARVVVATNANLKEKIDAGQFRNDLSFRLMVHHVDIPPLRNRREDVPILVEHFLAEAAESMGKPKPAAPPELWDILADYPFPGNVRELQFLVYDATTRHTSGPLPLEPFRRHVRANHDEPEAPEPPSPPEDGAQRFSYRGEFPQLQEVEDYFIEEALRLSDGNQSQAARLLGVSQSTLSRWARARRSTAPV